MFSNIVKAIKNQGQVTARLVSGLLKNEEYLLRHPERTFMLLSEAMKDEHFWPCLMADADCLYLCPLICEAIDGIQQRCFQDEFLLSKDNQLTTEEVGQFYAFVLFMNQLFL